MEKISVVIAILKMLLSFLADSDKDGRPNIFDADPNDPTKK